MFSNLAIGIDQTNEFVQRVYKGFFTQYLHEDFAAGNESKNSNRPSLLDANVRDYFVNLLCKDAPHSSKRNAWSKGTWEKITEEMKKKSPGLNLSTKQSKQLEKDLNENYQYIKHIESKPDFRWEDDNKMLKGSDDGSQKLLMRDSKAKKLHKKTLPCYSRLNTLYGGYHKIKQSEVVQSKLVSQASSHHAVGSGSMPTLTCAIEEVGESLPTKSRFGNNIKPNQNRCLELLKLHNSGSFSISPNQDLRSELQELNTRSSPKRPKTNDSGMTEQNEQPLCRSPPSPQNCGFESEPTIKNPSFAKNNYSINRCITEYYELQGFEQSDLPHVVEIFRDTQNREVFLTLQKCERGLWLRANIDSRKQNFPQNYKD